MNKQYCDDNRQDAHLAVTAILHDLLPDLGAARMDAYLRALDDLERIVCPKCRALNGVYLSSSGMLLTVGKQDERGPGLRKGYQGGDVDIEQLDCPVTSDPRGSVR